MRTSIIGSGKVGKSVGLGLLSLGNSVVFQDTSKIVVQDLIAKGFDATCSTKKAVLTSQICFICVPTPTTEGKIDLNYVEKATTSIAESLKDKREYCVIVVKSTVPPGTTENVVLKLLEQGSKKLLGKHFGLCVNPEFLTEIHSSWTGDDRFAIDFLRQPRNVIGEFDEKSGDTLANLYKSMDTPMIRTTMKTAEMIKYACNCALSAKISYWNEIYYICEKSGVDSKIVAEAASMDERIGKYGTIHGKAFGGKCLPKDLRAFIEYAETQGYDPVLLKAVEDVNLRIKAEKGVRE